MLPISLRNKIEIIAEMRARDERDRQEISCWDYENLGTRRKAYFTKELKYTIPYHSG